MKKSILLALIILLAFTNITSAQLVFDGGPDGTGTDFFDEANWVDTETGMDPASDTINPVEVTNGFFSGGFITSDLTIGGEFSVVAEGVGDDVANIRMTNGLTLTLEDNATLNCQLLTANAGEEINVVLSDNAELTIDRMVRTAFDLSDNANLSFVGTSPEFDTDRINFSSDWMGSVSTQVPNGGRGFLIGDNNSALFNSATVNGVDATNEDFDTVLFGVNFIHTLEAVSPPLLGDVNRDGVVNFLDIAPFINLLANPNVFQEEGDLNEDSVINFLDISPFIQVLAGGQ